MSYYVRDERSPTTIFRMDGVRPVVRLGEHMVLLSEVCTNPVSFSREETESSLVVLSGMIDRCKKSHLMMSSV